MTTTEAKNGAAIYLTEEETKLFWIFRQYQFIWERLFTNPPKGVKVELDFNLKGELKSAMIPIIYRI